MIASVVRKIVALLSIVLLAVTSVPASPEITGQLLAYQGGFIFFTTGDGFKVAPDVTILDYKTHAPIKETPHARQYARAVFNDAGSVSEIDISSSPLPIETLPDDIAKFVVAASPKMPNPDLAESSPETTNGVPIHFSGRPVLVTITVQVPPYTPATASIYITTDTYEWNPQAIQMDRIDALHYRITRRLASGTILHYLYTRGSFQSEELAENGLQRKPRVRTILDADTQTINDTVYGWTDQISGGQSSQPNAIPTPYNPAPFPNLPPGAPGAPPPRPPYPP